jgi:hypothetical protein
VGGGAATRFATRDRGACRRSLAAAFAAFFVLAAPAARAAPPVVLEQWSGGVASKSARLFARLQLDPARPTEYHFNYIARERYAANIAAGKDGFFGALTMPPNNGHVASGAEATVAQSVTNLEPETAYLYRTFAANSAGSGTGSVGELVTQAEGGQFALPDLRGWEMVSPADKNGGQIEGPGEVAGGGVLQAAADGNSVTYSSRAAFGSDAEGAPPGSQYVSRRAASDWSTENITQAVVSGSYGSAPFGVPYQLFSGDLRYALLLNGRPCRDEGSGCPVANPPLPGSGAPNGYQDYYLRDNGSGSFTALLDAADLAQQPLSASHFEVNLAGATADLSHVVLESCAAIGPLATEATAGEGCDAAAQNLYSYDRSSGSIAPLNLLPGDTVTTPGAALAAPAGAISGDGDRVYFYDQGGLYLREGSETKQLDAGLGGGGEFQLASADGDLAYFTKSGHLYRFEAGSGTASDLTPGGGVVGVLGASSDGTYLYYLASGGVFLRHGGSTTLVAAAADPSGYPPATGTSRVTEDGRRLLFLSSASITGYDNHDLDGGEPDAQVFLYDTATGLSCLSCNPTGGRPTGPSTVPVATVNGTQPRATSAYKPRVLVDGGNRVLFESLDALAGADTNAAVDVYQWESDGTGTCARSGGCISLISSGKSEGGAHLVDSSADGSDVFFRTDRSLVPSDPGAVDVYDARVGGGFPVPTPPLPCVGDACQALPSEPEDPAVNTLIPGAGNPPVHFFDTNRRRPRYHRLRNHRHKRRGGRRPGQHRRPRPASSHGSAAR